MGIFWKNEQNMKLLKQSFLYTFLLGLAAHGYCFLNLLICHDSLNSFSIASQWPKGRLGRFFYVFYITLTRGKIVLPWMIGLLALCWFALAVYLLIRLLKLEHPGYIFLTAGICVTNPSVYATAATYLHDLDANAFALFLSVSAAYLWNLAGSEKNMKKKITFLGIAAVILSVSLGIYQSYISVAITLMMLVSMKRLLNKENSRNVLTEGFWGIGTLAVTAGLYLMELKIFAHYTGITALNNDNYNSLGNMSSAFSGNVFEKILNTYRSFLDAFKNMIVVSDPEKMFLVVLGIFALCVGMMALLGLKNMDWSGRAIFALLAVLMPFGMNVSSFLSNGMFHVLMQYAVWFVYLLALILLFWIQKEEKISEKIKRIFGIAIMLCMVVTITENIQVSNTIYVKKDLEAQSTLSYMTRVAEKMEEQEAYIPGETPVVFVGECVIGVKRAGFEKYEIITGAEYLSPITYESTYRRYFRHILGRPIDVMEGSELKNDDRVLEMPSFPKEDSIQMIDGTLVVKLQ